MRQISFLFAFFLGLPHAVAQVPASSGSKISVARTKFVVQDQAGKELCTYEKPVVTHENKAIELKLNKKIEKVFERPCERSIEFEIDFVSEKLVSISFLTAFIAGDMGDTLLSESALNIVIDAPSGGILELSQAKIPSASLPALKTYCKKYLEPEVKKSGYEYDLDSICNLSESTSYSFTKKGVKLLVVSNTGSMGYDRWFGVVVPSSSLSASQLLFGLP
jgi:hypothetical protein